jgi:hypothetical protein
MKYVVHLTNPSCIHLQNRQHNVEKSHLRTHLRRRDVLRQDRKQQVKIPRLLKITRTSLPRSGRDRERGTAPHNKARRALVGGVGGALEPRGTHGPPNAQLPPLHTNPAHPSNGHPAASQNTLSKACGRTWQPCCWVTSVWEGSGSLEAQTCSQQPLAEETQSQGEGAPNAKAQAPPNAKAQGPKPIVHAEAHRHPHL